MRLLATAAVSQGQEMADTSKAQGMACTGSTVPDKTNRMCKQPGGRCRFILYNTSLFSLYSKLILLLMVGPHQNCYPVMTAVFTDVYGESPDKPKEG